MKSLDFRGEIPPRLLIDAAADMRRLYDEQQKGSRPCPRRCRVDVLLLQELEAKAAELLPAACTAPRARR